ncbi:MAG: hypothetical protein LBD10_02050 [Desulfobulbus sp.]|uniref:hypothetical protein n=1 Tax=Desulfobulbus sp. TaxID=895 RepID=UPI00284FEB8C|nr:hypothetical protein [Desulfobulbus sp.]MDR2548979.1 hypothetical protein [Desulfobulbus sp.]
MPTVDINLSEKLEKFEKGCCEFVENIDLFNEWDIKTAIENYDDVILSEQRVNPYFFSRILIELKNSFSHICSSPKREKIFYKAYCWPSVKDKQLNNTQKEKILLYKNNQEKFEVELFSTRSNPYVNISEKCIDSFVEYLCYLSHLPKDNELTKNTHKISFLTGDYGEGKTFLINYVLSTKQHIFDKNKCINVKIDFADSENIGSKELEIAISKKTIRILKDKYFSKNIFSIANLDRYLTSKDVPQQFIKKIINYFEGNYSHDIGNKNAVKIFNKIKEFIIYKENNREGFNYSFVFIIDGMDNVNRDTLSQRRFYDKILQIKEFIKKKISDSSYLIVMRPESHKYLERQCNEGMPQINDFRNFNLLPVDPYRIIEKKFNVFDNFLTSENDDSYIKRLPNNNNKFKPILSKFKNFLFQYLSYSFNKDGDENVFSLENLFNNNNRDIMNAIYIISRDIFSKIENNSNVKNCEDAIVELNKIIDNEPTYDEFIKKYYHLFHRSLILNKRYYALEQYGYEFYKDSVNDDLEKMDSRGIESDNVIPYFKPLRYNNFDERSKIPNVFHVKSPFNYNSESMLSNLEKRDIKCFCRSESEGTCVHSVFLIKFRILQFYNYYTSVIDPKVYLPLEDAIAEISHYFKYPVNCIKYETDMLYSLQCINKLKKNHDESRNNPLFKISKLGEFILNNLIFSYPYIENILDNVSVPGKFKDVFLGNVYSIAKVQDFWNVEGRIESDNYKRLAQCFSGKMIQTKSFSILLAEIEKRQLDFLDSNKYDPPFIYDNELKTRLVFKKSLEIVSNTIDKMLASNSDFNNIYLTPAMSNLLDSILQNPIYKN